MIRDEERTISIPLAVAGHDSGELQVLLSTGEVTSVDLVSTFLRRIEAYDHGAPGLNAMVTLDPTAIDVAAGLDAERQRGEIRGPLHGIPIVVKDQVDVAGLATTNGGLPGLGEVRPPDDATQVEILRAAGAVVLGKNHLFGSRERPVRNPHDRRYSAGGTSGGTAAAIAAGYAPIGVGSDTTGSIQVPASYGNIVGFRPTVGLTSCDGSIPFSRSYDVVGPMTTSVRDVALVLDLTARHDPKDPFTDRAVGRIPASFTAGLSRDALHGRRIGHVARIVPDDTDAGLIALMRSAFDDLVDLGAEIVDLSIDDLTRDAFGVGLGEGLQDAAWEVVAAERRDAIDAYLATSSPGLTVAELARRFPDAWHPNAWSARENPSPGYYERRLDSIRTFGERLQTRMADEGVSALAFPSTPTTAPLEFSNAVHYTAHLSPLAGGWPALSVPAGLTGSGLPVGLTFFGPAFRDADILAFGFAFEQATHHHRLAATTPELPIG